MRTDWLMPMRIDWDVPIPMDDGLVLCADVFRPNDDGRYPAILSYGPYAKGLPFQAGYPQQWQKLVEDYPEVCAASSCRYKNWEVVDPERWVPDGYVCVRVDSRGAGCSPGYLDIWSPRESRDLYACIEWAAAQPWSTGKVGLLGISYYAMNQWYVASLQPPHLTAMIPWEGAADSYRDVTYHGGIRCDFPARWYPRQVETVQYGLGERAPKSPHTGRSVAGSETLSEDELAGNRADYVADVRNHPLDDQWHRDRSPDWSRVQVPFLSAANWGGQGLHPRGNFEALLRAASGQKWLEVHGDTHWAHFYTDYGLDLQKRFFGHFLKEVNTGWDRHPRVLLNVRHADGGFIQRGEQEWPLARTEWTKLHLWPEDLSLRDTPAGSGSATYDAAGDGLTFRTAPLQQAAEITGPLAAHLVASSSTTDADIFLVFRVFDAAGQELVFQGALDPNTPIAQGWLRASHRRLDPRRSLPYRPFHPHDRVEPLTPSEIYELDIEIWPTCIVVPPGYQLALTVRGRDYEYPGELSEFAGRFHFASRGVGPFTHTEDVVGGQITLYSGAYLLLPMMPK